jgi:hypothetical protein
VKEKLIESFQNLAESVVDIAPKVITGIVLLILALIVAKVVEKILKIILVRVKVDKVVERTGIDKTLHSMGIRQELNSFIPRLVYFLILFLLAKTLADALGLGAISGAIGSFLAYLPNIVAALLLLILGSAAGQFVGKTVTQAAESSGIEFASGLGKLVSGLIIFIIGMMAMAQLKIDTDMMRIVTSLILAGAAVAFGLSFGLGSRDITRNVMAGFYARKVLEVGKNVEIDGQQGVLKAITTTHTIIETDDHSITIANAAFLDKIAKQ